MSPVARAIAAAVIANLLLFLAVVTLPAYQAAHHHWIFPVLAALFAAEWALTFTPSSADELVDRPALRDKNEDVRFSAVIALHRFRAPPKK